MNQARLRTIRCWLFILPLLLLPACRAVKMQVSDHIAPRDTWSVLVLPLSEAGLNPVAKDLTFYGALGPQGAGTLASREFSKALAAQPRIRLVPRSAAEPWLNEKQLSWKAAADLDDAAAIELGRAAGAQMVVLGRVVKYQTRWSVLISRSSVHLELRGLACDEARQAWSAKIKTGSFHLRGSELLKRTLEDLAADVADWLAALSVSPTASASAKTPS